MRGTSPPVEPNALHSSVRISPDQMDYTRTYSFFLFQRGEDPINVAGLRALVNMLEFHTRVQM